MEDETDTIEIDTKYLYSWGFGKYGQIGAKFVNYSLNPLLQTIDDKEEIFLVSAGESHSAILTLPPKLYVYGKNYFGQLGLGNNHYICSPLKLDISEKVKINNISCGGDHSLALSDNNLLYSWGLNVFGQLGLGDFLARKTPVKVELKNEMVVDIAAGAQHSLIRTSKNKIMTCGYAKFKALGYESEEDVAVFTQVEGLTCKNSFTKIACGVYHSGCVADNEVIYLWGEGEVIKLDRPTIFNLSSILTSGLTQEKTSDKSVEKSEISISSSTQVSPSKKVNPANYVRDLKIAEDAIYILNKNDDVFCMGDNKFGQLGNNSTENSEKFIKIEAPKAKQIEVGYHFVMLIAYDNKIYGWGSNEYGQLTISNSRTVLKPTYLEELSKMGVYKLACGGYHCLGLFGNMYSDPTCEINNQSETGKIISEVKQNLKICNLNSTVKKDVMNNIEKIKFADSMKAKLIELENDLQTKENELKELKLKDEELSKLIKESTTIKKPIVIDNPRGFDNNFEISMEEIEFYGEDDIGKGTFGEVRHGIWRKEQVAVKFLKSEMVNSEENINAFIEECNFLKNLRHPNILLFMGASTTPPYYFIVTEFCEKGNLFELLHQNKHTISLSWEDKRRIALEIALGMNYLHSFKPPILHRDLKSMNILLDKNYQIKIADFGSTKFLMPHMTKQKGTFQWMAPEVIKSNSYTEKVDVFSFGIIMNELASRQPPYYGVEKREVAKSVAAKPDFRPAISKSYPRDWVELMVKCWDHYPNKRPSYSEIVDALIKMKFPEKK